MTQNTFDTALRNAAVEMQRLAREEQYRYDIKAWAEDKFGIFLWSKQLEVVDSIINHKRTAVFSCHSGGKSFLAALVACWWIDTHPLGEAIVVSTAPTYPQINKILWEEIRKLHSKTKTVTLPNGRTFEERILPGYVTQGDEWKLDNGEIVGFGRKPADTNIHGFQGIHRRYVLVILDEAGGIPQALYTGVEAITTTDDARILAIGNPDDPNTEFGDIERKNRNKKDSDRSWHLVYIPAASTPNFSGEEVPERLKKLLLQKAWVEDALRDWGEDDPRYVSKVLARFPTVSIDSLFTAQDLEYGRACEIVPGTTSFRVLGVDVARYGEDRSVIVMNEDGHITVVASFNTNDLMELAARVHKIAKDKQVDQVRVDGIGPGGGVVDRLIQLSQSMDEPYVVIEMSASASPPDKTLHRNARAFWYESLKFQMRNELVDLPDHDDLFKELGGVRFMYPHGVLQIESKEDIRKRGDKSPDFVDALVMAVAPINNIVSSPLATYRPGQLLAFDIKEGMEGMVSPV